MAARLSSAGAAGQILVSASVASAVNGMGIELRQLGEMQLKGLDRPVQVLRLG